MSRALGDKELKQEAGVVAEAEVVHVRTQPAVGGIDAGADGDLCVIIATDGLWDVVDNTEAVEIATKHKHATQASIALVEIARTRWREKSGNLRDDITVIVVNLPFLQSEDAPPRVNAAPRVSNGSSAGSSSFNRKPAPTDQAGLKVTTVDSSDSESEDGSFEFVPFRGSKGSPSARNSSDSAGSVLAAARTFQEGMSFKAKKRSDGDKAPK
jgi:hypothetical protein